MLQQDKKSAAIDQDVVEDDSESNLRKLNIFLAINRAYQEAVDEKLKKLNQLLNDNLSKQVNRILCFRSIPVFHLISKHPIYPCLSAYV